MQIPSHILRGVGIALSFLGMAFMVYLVHVHFSSSETASFCDFAPGFSCDVVNKSAFAEVMGIPMSILGFIYFALAALYFIFGFVRADILHILLSFSVFSLVFSAYLTFVEVRLLGSICLFCEASKAAMLGITAIFATEVPRRDQALSYSMVIAALIAGIAFSLIAYRLATT